MTPDKLKFVLDSDTFIRAARTHYSFDFAMTFWNGLINFAQNGIICTIDKVYEELILGDDALSDWIKNKFPQYILDTQTDEILSSYTQLISWVQQQNQFTQNAKDEFYELDNADAWLIAFANSHDITLVTHEIFNPTIKKKVPIPNVCQLFNIRYIDIYQMLKELNFHF